MELELTTLSGFAVRLIVSVFLGFIIGFERQWTRHPAGILTNVIVCAGAFMFTSFSAIAYNNNADITRIASGVVSGVGFLGAGVILREGMNIRGLNTAATIWATSAVGVLCCATPLWYAIIAGVTIVLCHVVFHPVSSFIIRKRFNQKDKAFEEHTYSISVITSEDAAAEVRERLMFAIKNEKSVLLRTLETKNMEEDDVDCECVKIKAILSSVKNNEDKIEKIITFIGSEKHVIKSGWKMVE